MNTTIQHKMIQPLTIFIRGLARLFKEAREMIEATQQHAWGVETPYNFAAWAIDWLLRLRCWVFGIPCPYCCEEGAQDCFTKELSACVTNHESIRPQ